MHADPNEIKLQPEERENAGDNQNPFDIAENDMQCDVHSLQRNV